MQNYQRIYDYINEYWNTIYDVYSKHGVAYLVTYYNIDITSTVWDNEFLMGGSYEKIGALSGIKWNKYLLLPAYFIGETDTIFDAQETGYVNEGDSELVIPDSYGLVPYANDMVVIGKRQYYSTDESQMAIYAVTGLQKQGPDKTYWKLKLSVEQSRTNKELDAQVSNNYVFYEYDKKVHTIPNSISMTNMLSKSATLRLNLKSLYDQNSGLYFV